MAHFTLPPRAVSKAVASDNLEELWYFISGHGQMWRRLGSREEIVDVGPGLCINIPAGTHFQFRSNTDEPLMAVGATMPPCTDSGDVYAVQAKWDATV
jgi:mannose-6-phosphate isomerase-like protein (cupin superfamily)